MLPLAPVVDAAIFLAFAANALDRATATARTRTRLMSRGHRLAAYKGVGNLTSKLLLFRKHARERRDCRLLLTLLQRLLPRLVHHHCFRRCRQVPASDVALKTHEVGVDGLRTPQLFILVDPTAGISVSSQRVRHSPLQHAFVIGFYLSPERLAFDLVKISLLAIVRVFTHAPVIHPTRSM